MNIEILLVDDSATDAELILRTLRKGNVTNDVVCVRDGVEALDYIFRRGGFNGRTGAAPCLILLDLNMPKVGGIEVLQQLKAQPETKSIPVVVLTSSVAQQDIVESYNLGVSSYLVKPVSLAAFSEVVGLVGLCWTITTSETA